MSNDYKEMSHELFNGLRPLPPAPLRTDSSELRHARWFQYVVVGLGAAVSEARTREPRLTICGARVRIHENCALHSAKEVGETR